jgi:hypothetical protein
MDALIGIAIVGTRGYHIDMGHDMDDIAKTILHLPAVAASAGLRFLHVFFSGGVDWFSGLHLARH